MGTSCAGLVAAAISIPAGRRVVPGRIETPADSMAAAVPYVLSWLWM
jgi:hypothetical protein